MIDKYKKTETEWKPNHSMLSLCRNYDSVFNVKAEMKETDAEN